MSEKEYCWSANNEDFNYHDLNDLLESHPDLKAGDTVFMGEVVRPDVTRFVTVTDILETISDRAWGEAGEHAEDYPNVSKEAEQELKDFLAGWLNKHCQPHFWTVANEKPYVLGADDTAAFSN